jgi:hypothetical protein
MIITKANFLFFTQLKKLVLIQLLSLLFIISCNKTDNDTPIPIEIKPKETVCSIQTINYPSNELGEFQWRYSYDPSGDIIGIDKYSIDLKALLSQTTIEYDSKKQPTKINSQEINKVVRKGQDPIYLHPTSNSITYLFTYDSEGKLISSKTSLSQVSSFVQNITFEYSTDKVVATERWDYESQDEYSIISFDYKEGNLIKKTLQRFSPSYPYTYVEEYEYTQELDKNTKLNRINALMGVLPFASKNLVKSDKILLSSSTRFVNYNYEFNEYGYVIKSDNTRPSNNVHTYTYECK